MLNIKMKFIRGVFFIRLEGSLNKNTHTLFKDEVFPLLVDQGIKRVVLNLDELIYIDSMGLKTILSLEKLLKEHEGIMRICSLTHEKVKSVMKKQPLYESTSELTAIGEMKI